MNQAVVFKHFDGLTTRFSRTICDAIEVAQGKRGLPFFAERTFNLSAFEKARTSCC